MTLRLPRRALQTPHCHRYLGNVGLIDAAISNVVQRQTEIEETYPELRAKFGGNLGEYFLDTTDAANRRLIELESVVVEDCAAAAVSHRDSLFSDEYTENKAILLEGLQALSDDVVATIQVQEAENIATVNALYYYVVISLISIRGAVGLAFSYYYVKLNWLDDKVKVASVKAAIEATLNNGGSSASRPPPAAGGTMKNNNNPSGSTQRRAWPEQVAA
eukprot:scaffold362464_cov31-Prasinocladus_malaysianus.AAC.1